MQNLSTATTKYIVAFSVQTSKTVPVMAASVVLDSTSNSLDNSEKYVISIYI